MIFFSQPQDGLLTAVDKAFNSVLFPDFSNVKIEDGHLTIEVDYKNRPFKKEEMLEHLHDSHLRILAKYDNFPYKFQGFEHKTTLDKFRITSTELENWRDHAAAAVNSSFNVEVPDQEACFSSSTSVNRALLDTLEKACAAMDYYKDRHMDEYVVAQSKGTKLHEGWRHEVG